MKNRRDRESVRATGVAPGDYVCSPTKLFCLERIDNERAVLEDCRTGDLIQVPLYLLCALRRVRRPS